MRAHASRAMASHEEARRHNEGAATLQAQLAAAQKQLAQQRDVLAEAEERFVKDRSKRQRLEEEREVGRQGRLQCDSAGWPHWGLGCGSRYSYTQAIYSPGRMI